MSVVCQGCDVPLRSSSAFYDWEVCEECAEDYCTRCGEVFGFSGDDENGWNCTCVHCGNTTYETRVREAT